MSNSHPHINASAVQPPNIRQDFLFLPDNFIMHHFFPVCNLFRLLLSGNHSIQTFCLAPYIHRFAFRQFFRLFAPDHPLKRGHLRLQFFFSSFVICFCFLTDSVHNGSAGSAPRQEYPYAPSGRNPVLRSSGLHGSRAGFPPPTDSSWR